MRSDAAVVASGRTMLLLLLSCLLCAAVKAKDQPSVSVKTLDHVPMALSYFEDSDVIVFHDYSEGNIYRSADAGVSWDRVKDIPDGEAFLLQMHEFDSKTVFVITQSAKLYKSDDQAASWTAFNTGDTYPSEFQLKMLSFHASDPNRVIFNGRDSPTIFGMEQAVYTTDGFNSVKLLRTSTEGCWWAKSSRQFTTGEPTLDEKRTMCIFRPPMSLDKSDQKLVISDSYFATSGDGVEQFEPNFSSNHGGVINLAVVNKFIIVATASMHSDELALYVSEDTKQWHRAMFPSDEGHGHSHRLNHEAYTILEGTNYSIQVDVMTSKPSQPMGIMFTSNSNGTLFTENIANTNRNLQGLVDFEKISGIQGVFLVNTVKNAEDVDENGARKKIVTDITFDDGRTFQPIHAGEERIHLHSVTEIDNVGRIFSSPAPGIVMGNGNTGKTLGSFSDSNLYVSDDAGLTWKEALKGPHKYEFGGSGSILLAVADSDKEDVGKISYSVDHGEHWESVPLPDDTKIKPSYLTTTQDSTSLKFLLIGRDKSSAYRAIAIDFHGLGKRKCGEKDMEDWHARVDEEGNPTCIMGHKQTYRRRKKSADCFVETDFQDPSPRTDDCECTDADFECDYNFRRDPDDNSRCVRAGPIRSAEEACKGNPDGTFMGSSGWRLIPGNTCKRAKGKQKDDQVEWKCSEDGAGSSPPASGAISREQFMFDTELGDFQKVYLDRPAASSDDDETVIVRPAEDQGNGMLLTDERLWLSKDHGKSWEQILKGEKIEGIYPHDHFSDVVYFTTNDKKVIYTTDRGRSFHSFEVPTKPADVIPFSFHPDKKDWLIWIGKSCDNVGGHETCFREASLSQDRGDHWQTLLRFASKCEFTGNSVYKLRPARQIVCLANREERTDSPLTLFTSDDFFDENKEVLEGEVSNFAFVSEFIVVARLDKETGDLHALASLDGKHFEQARFPYNFRESHENQFTVLDSSTHAVNLFVLTEGGEDRQFGSIIKSNSNGTSYVLSASNVNSNEETYVDFEKVQGLEGVVLINVVTNPQSQQKTKTLQTKISHNDGSEWGYLAPPAKDVQGKSYECSSSGTDKCALHLHHYTERDDKRKTFAADTAVGLLFGVGNVGQSLGDIKDADTFMTTDGGVTWKNVKRGHWTWQYGDQGSIIVLVQRTTRDTKVKTKIVSYSLDEGETWTDYTFTDEEVSVLDITTLRLGTSRNFLLWCKSNSGKLFTVNLDFSGLTDKACQLEAGEASDYYLWAPKHPLQDDDCLFGHVARYLRKKTDRKCYNEKNLQRLYDYTDCACSRRDYECAYNYELDNHGQCALVSSLEPMSGQQWCEKHPNATSYFEPTGYRKVPLSTCKGGNELDKTSKEHPCAGYEEEFQRRRGTPGVLIFFAVLIPFSLAGFIGWYVWRNWSGKIGQIRLGDTASSFEGGQPWIRYPVMALSFLAATAAAIPLAVTSIWRRVTAGYASVSGGRRGRSWFSRGPRRFTTRDSFARGRADYSMVDEDEGELLGEESDDEL